MTTRVQKVGDGLAVVFPPAIVSQAGLTADVEIDITLENGALVARKPGKPRFTLEELLRDLTPDQLHPETDTGPAVGREEW